MDAIIERERTEGDFMQRFTVSVLFFLALGFFGCTTDECLTPHYDWGFDYDVNPTYKTPYGIKVDTTNQALHQNFNSMLDKITQEVEACLAERFPNNSLKSVYAQAYCNSGHEFTPKANKKCLEVKVPDDWLWSRNKEQQFINNRAGDKGCLDKGFSQESIDKYGCYWRVGLQDGYKIITPPNLYLYKDALVKYITGCDNVWYSELAVCASPGFEPTWVLE